MPDLRNQLQAKFAPNHRHANFGEVLNRIHVKGFRCHSNTILDVASPITALCGLNGTGKSTLLQLLAIAYRRNNGKPYYINDFLVTGPLDPTPFTNTAEIEYRYWVGPRLQKTVTVSRRARTQRWSGYKRRPIREVYFAGIGHYLPRIEQRDFVVRNAKNIQITGERALPQHVREAISKILGCQYNTSSNKSVIYFNHRGTVLSVDRGGIEYSEAHMGFGEGRTQSLIVALESLPDKSLVLIEEPETSLHPSAQHALAKYLMDVSIRKGHQIFLTTHSEYLLMALPAASRVYLTREPGGAIRCVAGLSAAEARSLMTEGRARALSVLVEDDCARALLRELLRRTDPGFLETVGIYVGGDANTLLRAVQALREARLPIAAVRDGDQQEIPRENVFKLPGTEPPEKEIFKNDRVRQLLQEKYGISVADFMAAVGDADHHDWLKRLAERLNKDEAALTGELAETYAATIPENDLVSLRDALRGALG